MSYGEAVSPVLRPATPGDVPEIARIYGYAVRESVATFDVTDPPLSYWLEKLASVESGDHVVVEDAGVVVGYAYSTRFRPRPAYARTRERAVYLAPGAVGHGLGRLAYLPLLSLLRADRMHCVVALWRNRIRRRWRCMSRLASSWSAFWGDRPEVRPVGRHPNPPISVPRPDGRRRGEGWVGCERLGVIGSAPSAP